MLTRSTSSNLLLTAIVAGALGGALGGCGSMPGSSASPAPAAPAPASAPAAPAGAKGVQPGMNANGEVIDSRAVVAGSGKSVKGKGDWEGEITGKPVPGSKFSKLEIGMSIDEVNAILGPPTDSGSHITGKAFIPWYFGSDKYRFEAVYKGQGRLIFASSNRGGWGGWGNMGGNLTWIIHSASETGVR